MAAPIGPGDWVECVGPFVGEAPAAALRALGYRFDGKYSVGLLSVCEDICAAVRRPDGSICSGIKVRDIKAFNSAGQEVWLNADQWRPIYRPKSELIESLKAPPVRKSVSA